MELVRQSFAAYSVTEDHQFKQDRIAMVINGEIVSESESGDPEAYVGISQPWMSQERFWKQKNGELFKGVKESRRNL